MNQELSLAQRLELPDYAEEKRQFLQSLAFHCLSKHELKQKLDNLKYQWSYNARPKQLTPPGDWYIWLIRSGRGWGKTRTLAEWIREKEADARAQGIKVEMALVGHIYQDIVDAQVGEIIRCYPPGDPNCPKFKNGKLQWASGCIAHLIQAETPEKFKSKNLTYVWMDELAKYQYPEKIWDAARLVTRIGKRPQIAISTTPAIYTNKLLNKIEKHHYGQCVLTIGSTYENAALSTEYKNTIVKSYEGTRLGSQELYGNYVEALVGALWQSDMIHYWKEFEEAKLLELKKLNKTPPEDFYSDYFSHYIKQVVVAVDPAITAHAKSNETGIIVVARDYQDRGFILEDRSGKYTPNQWAEMAISLHKKYSAKCIVAEANQGGDMVANTIHTCNPHLRVELVRASKGKIVRAEPVARLYERGLIYHCRVFGELEYQMLNYTGLPPDKDSAEVQEENSIDSPDRLDALVWGLTFLFSDKFVKPARGLTPFRISFI